MTGRVKPWYAAADLLGLPGVPGTVQSINAKAKREGWISQPRAGRGGGKEYSFRSLPEETQQHLTRATLPAVASAEPDSTQNVPAEPQPKAAMEVAEGVPALSEIGSLKGWQRERMTARLAILMEVDRLGAVIGTEKAIRTVISQAEQGALAPELQRFVPVANARSGGAEGKRTLSRRTLYRWLTERDKGHAALAPRPMERHVIPEWAPALLDLYQRPSKPSMVWALEQLPSRLPEGVEPPSYWVANRFLKKMGRIERERGRMGPRDLRNIQPFRRRSFHELWPGDIYSMDGHTFDAEIRHPQHGRPFRPEVTSCIDIATRRLVGWSVALAESGWAVLDALRAACIAHGIPAILYVDNGSGYCNALMDDVGTGLLTRLAITKETSIPCNSQARGVIERLHQTLWVRAAKTLPTFIGADMDPEAKQKVFKLTRKEIKESGESRYLMPFQEFVTWAEAQVTAYNARPHRSLPKVRDAESGKQRHQSPDEAWAAAAAEGWEPVAVMDGEADDLFRPYRVRKTERGEVSLFGNTYFHKGLADYTGEMVRVGYDIHDASRVWVRDRNDRLLCVAEFEGNASSYYPVTAIEEAAAKRAKGRLARAERAIDEIEAEHQGILGQIPTAAEASDDEKAASAAMLARLDQLQAERIESDREEELARRAATDQQLAAIPEPEQAQAPTAVRPEFSTDYDLWLWVEDHPEAATEQDRAYLEQALAESPALQVQVDAERAKRARRR